MNEERRERESEEDKKKKERENENDRAEEMGKKRDGMTLKERKMRWGGMQ